MSIDYNIDTGECHLQTKVQATAGEDYYKPCYFEETSWYYMERITSDWISAI
jgi:hypothetical protein